MVLPRIKEIRKKLNMTQEEFSDYLTKEKNINISRGTIAKYESGVNFPAPNTIKKLSQALGVSENYLAGKGANKEDIDNLITELLHNIFFNFRSTFPEFNEVTDRLKNLISAFLSLKKTVNQVISLDEAKKYDPWYLYKDNEGNIDPIAIKDHYPRSKKSDDFWRKYFNFLYEPNFIDSLVGTSKAELIKRITQRIDKEYDSVGLKFNIDSFLETIDDFSSNVKLDIYEWQNGLKTKKEIDKDISDRLDYLCKFIPRLGFTTKEDKDEQ